MGVSSGLLVSEWNECYVGSLGRFILGHSWSKGEHKEGINRIQVIQLMRGMQSLSLLTLYMWCQKGIVRYILKAVDRMSLVSIMERHQVEP